MPAQLDQGQRRFIHYNPLLLVLFAPFSRFKRSLGPLALSWFYFKVPISSPLLLYYSPSLPLYLSTSLSRLASLHSPTKLPPLASLYPAIIIPASSHFPQSFLDHSNGSFTNFDYYVPRTLRSLMDVTTSTPCSFYFYLPLLAIIVVAGDEDRFGAVAHHDTLGPLGSQALKIGDGMDVIKNLPASSPTRSGTAQNDHFVGELSGFWVTPAHPHLRRGLLNMEIRIVLTLGDLTNGLEYTYPSPSAYTSTLGIEINQAS
ncbi:hypothetical protein ONZ45_g17652 [Pleurotus djamor]|nr:hypothetical protein ONZ45_g17652 [Pleurotus djamor]